jgi:hypothetical protein
VRGLADGGLGQLGVRGGQGHRRLQGGPGQLDGRLYVRGDVGGLHEEGGLALLRVRRRRGLDQGLRHLILEERGLGRRRGGPGTAFELESRGFLRGGDLGRRLILEERRLGRRRRGSGTGVQLESRRFLRGGALGRLLSEQFRFRGRLVNEALRF